MALVLPELEDRAKKLDNRFKLTEQAVDDILKSTTGIARHAERISAVDVTPKLPATDEPALRLVTTKIHKGENE